MGEASGGARGKGWLGLIMLLGVVTLLADAAAPEIVDSVTVTPDSVTFTVVGQTAELTATGFDSGGSVIPGLLFVWSSTDPAIASVLGQGATATVTAVGEGLAVIRAEVDGVVGEADVVVILD